MSQIGEEAKSFWASPKGYILSHAFAVGIGAIGGIVLCSFFHVIF